MEIDRAHFAFRRFLHHESELPDENESYTTIRCESSAATRGGRGGAGVAAILRNRGGGQSSGRHRYNPLQRVATAHRLLLTVAEAFLVGQTLSFAALSDLRPPIRVRAAVSVPEAIQAGIGRRVLPCGAGTSGRLGGRGRRAGAEGTAQQVCRRARVRWDRATTASARPGAAARLRQGSRWNEVPRRLQHQDRTHRAREPRCRDRVRDAALQVLPRSVVEG